jgi:hypothetical protein
MMDCKSDSLSMDYGAGQAGTEAIFISSAASSVTSQRRFVFRHHFCITHDQRVLSVAGYRGFQESFSSIRGADDTLGEQAPKPKSGAARSLPERLPRNGRQAGATS